jgi:uncharacterized protein
MVRPDITIHPNDVRSAPVQPATREGESALVSRVEERIQGYGAPRAVVAFSGGVDSSVVLALAARALGHAAITAVTAVSPSLAAGELEAARSVAVSIGVDHRTIATHEVEREAYARNDALRCFHCKTELYTALRRLAARHSSAGTAVLAGANADDARDFRPGLMASERHRIRNPLLEERVGKEAVRAIARRMGLEVADKPALACLSSRVQVGIRITPGLLARIDRAERAVLALGFQEVRVRHLGPVASIEVAPSEVERLRSHPGLPSLMASVRALGWDEVQVDPEGYRMGKLSAALLSMTGDLAVPPLSGGGHSP